RAVDALGTKATSSGSQWISRPILARMRSASSYHSMKLEQAVSLRFAKWREMASVARVGNWPSVAVLRKLQLSSAGNSRRTDAQSTRWLSLLGSLLDHDFGRLDDYFDRVAFLKTEFFGTSAGDDAFDQVVSNLDDHMRHDGAELHAIDDAGKLIASRECHVLLYQIKAIACLRREYHSRPGFRAPGDNSSGSRYRGASECSAYRGAGGEWRGHS